MKNLKVAYKLIFSFLFVAVLTAAVGVVGIMGMRTIDQDSTAMYEMQTVPMPYMAYILEDTQKLRVNVREFYIAAVYEDIGRVEEINTDVGAIKTNVTRYLDLYEATIVTSDARALFQETRSLLNNSYAPHLDRVYAMAKEASLPGVLFRNNFAPLCANREGSQTFGTGIHTMESVG